MISIDVVIPTVLTDPGKLKRAVESALTQSLPPRQVIVVVDRHEAILPQFHHARVVVMRNTRTRRGAAAARNAGVRAASSSLVAFLDDDDYWLPDKLSRQTELLARSGHRSIVASRVYVLTMSGLRITPDRPHDPERPLADYLFPPPGLRSSPNHSVSTPTILAPRQLLIEHAFDEGLTQWEDLEWLLRVTDTGVKLLWSSRPLAVIDQTRNSGASLSQLVRPDEDEEWADHHLAPRSARAWHNHLLTYAVRGYAHQGRRSYALRLIVRAAMHGQAHPPLLVKALVAVVVPTKMYARLKTWRHSPGGAVPLQ